ncbi:16S rRNA (guanine(966)-N(2))-methyltransferase RsmD [Gordonia sp. NPDC003950]
MTRIIAGRFGGRRLKVPDDGTRPTSDRVREALFSMLAARIDLDGAHVLDLYAGSGALAVEALSRGAASATCVDARRRATGVITANVTALGLGADVQVVTSSVSTFLAGAPSAPFDLVFSDPPYAIDPAEIAEDLARLGDRWVSSDALIVLERARRTSVTWPDHLEVIVTKNYGDTAVDVGVRRPGTGDG